MVEINTIKQKLFELEKGIAVADVPTLSLLTGQMSIAVFYACLFTNTGNPKYKRKCNRIVNNVIAKIEVTELSNGFCQGFTGIAWGINYINSLNIVNIDRESFFEDVDGLIYNYSLLAVQNGYFDFMHQGLGGAVYALDRLPSKDATMFLHNIVDALDEIKKADESGFTFDDKLSDRELGSQSEPKYSLGMAHGTTGVVSLLLRIYEEGINRPLAEKLIKGSIQWILNHKIPLPKSPSIFPHSFIGSVMVGFPSKLAWCYGDLSIAYVLFCAAKIFNRGEWLSEALATMQNCIGRREPLSNPDLDPMFCHGTVGISYLFNKFYYLTGDDQYLMESHFWLEKTLNFAVHKDSPGGFKKIDVLRGKIWVNDYGILDGVSGIGLTYLSFLRPDLDWDKSLLLYQRGQSNYSVEHIRNDSLLNTI